MKKVLIADDERALRLLVRATLESSRIAILEAANGREALELARAEKPDLVLLDVQMPELDGFTVCQMIKADPATSHIPVVILTAYGFASDAERSKGVGAAHHLMKPFSPFALLNLVNRLLGLPGTAS
jgi:CheY-like chemotaxis protein